MLKMVGQLRRMREKERELTESRAQLRRLSARLINAEEEERERISRELHDELGQLLTAIGLDIEWSLSRRLPEDQELSARLAEARALVQRAVGTTRELCATLRAEDLRGRSLADAIRLLADEFGRRCPIAVSCADTSGDPAFPPDVARHIYRIAQEALSNVSRHASATSVAIELSRAGGNFVLRIDDDGKGFDPAQVKDPRAVGLVGIRERAVLIGGRLEIHSAPGEGARIELEVPLNSAARNHPA